MSKNKTQAKITLVSQPDYQPTKPPGYFYMFTGGYKIVKGLPHKAGDDEGPAGNAAFDKKADSLEIKVKDDTQENFRIVKWTLKSPNTLGLTFDPAPDTELTPTKKLTINVDDVPTGHTNEYEEFGITLENDQGDRVELDPRLYDIR